MRSGEHGTTEMTVARVHPFHWVRFTEWETEAGSPVTATSAGRPGGRTGSRPDPTSVPGGWGAALENLEGVREGAWSCGHVTEALNP